MGRCWRCKMPLQFKTHICDPVHRSVRLTDLERKVIDTRAFQRLRRVKQLGLACLAFPSADYPRFEHSLGVAHLTGRLLETLQAHGCKGLTDEIIQKYRLAALLHDVGHYPFSHAMDDAIDNYYGSFLLTSTTQQGAAPPAPPQRGLSHEQVGKLVLLHDHDLSRVLQDGGQDADEIARIFNREDPNLRFVNMISSDLDADRLDYLARTSCHTGMPYGTTDFDYLIEQVYVDDQDRLCFDEKALRSVEHVLLSRYFDYQSIVRHRVVAGMEMLLQDVLCAMLRASILDCTEAAVTAMIQGGGWQDFDDLSLMQKLREFERSNQDQVLAAKLRCILNRIAPKAVAEAEWFDRANALGNFQLALENAKGKLKDWALHFNIPQEYWFIWEPHKHLEFTKSSPQIPADALNQKTEKLQDKYEQSARILRQHAQNSNAIIEMPRSLLSVLSGYKFFTFRVFVIPPVSGPAVDKELQRKINVKIREDCPHISWK